MKSEEYSYQPVSVQLLTEGLRSLLFGEISARKLCDTYGTSKPALEKFRTAEKESIGSYLLARSLIPGIISFGESRIFELKGWENPFYRYSEKSLESFHPLCEFYREFVFLESRLIVCVTDNWRKAESLSGRELHYKILALIEILSVFVRLTEERSQEDPESEDDLTGKMRRYLARLIKFELGCTLLELSIRFQKMLGPKGLTPESLYIYILNQTVPDPLPIYNTIYFTQHILKYASNRQKSLSRLQLLISEQVTDRSPVNASHKKEQMAIRRLLENIICAAFFLEAMGAKENEIIELWNDPEKGEKIIDYYRKQIESGKGDEIKANVYPRLPQLEGILESLKKGGSLSGAGLLLNVLKHSPPVISSVNGVSENQTMLTGTYSDIHPVLRDLVSVDELKDRLQISMVTLNKYLQESGISVIKFSAKSRWLHSEDCRKFLDYYTTNTGSASDDDALGLQE